MAKEVGDRLKILGALLKIERGSQVTELVHCHVNAHVLGDGTDDLPRQRLLILVPSAAVYEQISARVRPQAWHDFPPIPADAVCHVLRDLEVKLAPAGLCLVLWDE